MNPDNTPTYAKPLPTITDENREYWEGAKQGKLRMQRCRACGHIRYPISFVCSDCLSYETEWVDLSGRGEVFSFIVFYQIYNKAFAADIPYNVALIQLEEGPRVYSNIVDCDNDAVKVGDKVHVVFDPVTPEVTIPKFRLETAQAERS
jgi:uncharacterized OB-fold protein